jgi:hypothetical protein
MNNFGTLSISFSIIVATSKVVTSQDKVTRDTFFFCSSTCVPTSWTFSSLCIFLCRSQWTRSLKRRPWSLGCCDRGFKSRFRHGCLSSYALCCVLVEAFVQRSPTECLNKIKKPQKLGSMFQLRTVYSFDLQQCGGFVHSVSSGISVSVCS